ncbi:hypothetical protein [Paraclostridium sordellii]|uniref:Alternate signal-mediated exported protein n=1 Tax=Paraclostridium sordellii TaxID=1505 RepID=A0A0C7IW82_PARSO|nr:hypothetical protein [Paeniclostridium sordellii]MDU2688845.1 hypothetical protein [Paeniclostridium sordellii]MDU6115431.1 hypothetical protein [Paeniclostridium sordellii]MDU6247427.1 hypothetical protein [Paeniclostridium sordellii]MVO71276.1 hypothetical protein [Paeniclostridium sordellii]QYE97963.1 M73 family metallopeptidase [Paeniclostridium sordellii]
MKKNKTVAYALAATLLVGGTFLGTKALFTDKVDTVGELSISTGDVDIVAEVTQDWTLDRNGYEPNTGTSDGGRLAQFDNLKYGDVLTKKVTITNKGTLKALVNFTENEAVTDKLPTGINFTAEFKDSKGNKLPSESTMDIGSSATVDLKLEVVGGGNHNDKDSLNSDKQEQTILELRDAYVLNAQQQNPKGK